MIELEGIDPKHLKRMRPDSPTDSDNAVKNSYFSTYKIKQDSIEKITTRIKTMSLSPPKH